MNKIGSKEQLCDISQDIWWQTRRTSNLLDVALSETQTTKKGAQSGILRENDWMFYWKWDNLIIYTFLKRIK